MMWFIIFRGNQDFRGFLVPEAPQGRVTKEKR